MASTSGQDEAIFNKTNLSIDKFNSHISSVCHLALPNALSEDTIEGFVSIKQYYLHTMKLQE
jgi:hypothetical protein